jgi:hypothetical protein
MKKILYLFLMISGFIACKSKTKPTINDSLANNSVTKKQTEELIKKFGPIIQGVWVKADYVNKVIKTKSPLAATDEATGITTMYINTDHIKGDSIVFIAGYFNHDSGDCIIKFHPGKNPSTILFNGKDLSYLIEKGDTTLTVFQYENKKNHFISAKYIRVLNKQSDDNFCYGLDYYINRALVTGNYTFTDSTGVNSKINFSEDGRVSGFLNFKTYSINIDLNSDVNDNLDEIGFDRYSKHHLSCSFKISADTLNLYETLENADSTELVLGKLKYKLVRQR